jgi:hypothetical protein
MLHYEDFAALGTYLHDMAESAYHRMLVFMERVKRLR